MTNADGYAECTIQGASVIATILSGGVQASYPGQLPLFLPSSGSSGLIG